MFLQKQLTAQLNERKYGPENLQIRTFFTQCLFLKYHLCLVQTCVSSLSFFIFIQKWHMWGTRARLVSQVSLKIFNYVNTQVCKYVPCKDLQGSISLCNFGANTKFAVPSFEFEIDTQFNRQSFMETRNCFACRKMQNRKK